MKIVDTWEMNGKTAIYCTGEKAETFAKKQSVTIADKKYKVVGYDILTSISGIKALMLLLDTKDKINLNQKIE